MEKWRRVWREGIEPNLSRASIEALKEALIKDDARLLQGVTCYPPLLTALKDRKVEGACGIAFCGWQGEKLDTVGELELFFQNICDTADKKFNEPASCCYFLNWFDDTPREEMRRQLLEEINNQINNQKDDQCVV